DEWRARYPDADAADGGILRGAEDAWRAGEAAAVQRRISRHRIQTVEFHSHSAIYDVVVQTVDACRRWARHDDGIAIVRCFGDFFLNDRTSPKKLETSVAFSPHGLL